jgi:hypothetical protein
MLVDEFLGGLPAVMLSDTVIDDRGSIKFYYKEKA